MSYEELIERIEAEESEQDYPLMTSVQLREAIKLVEDFDSDGVDSGYSERELSTITALKVMLTAYETAVIGPVPTVLVTMTLSDGEISRDRAVALMSTLSERGLYYNLVESSASTLVLSTRTREEWLCEGDVAVALRRTFYTRADGKMGSLSDRVYSITAEKENS